MTIQNVFSREEYADLMWEGVKGFIAGLDKDDRWDSRDKLFQVFGYLEGYRETDDGYTE